MAYEKPEIVAENSEEEHGTYSAGCPTTQRGYGNHACNRSCAIYN